MADKFCQPGLATGLNDGTSPANAWNNFEQVVEGTIANGSYDENDIIYVATNDGTSDISVNVSSLIVFQIIGTASTPMRMIFDDGTKFPANGGGTLTFNLTNDTALFEWRRYWEVDGQDRLKFSINRTNNNSILRGSGRLMNFELDLLNSGQGQKITARYDTSGNQGKFIVENPTINFYGTSSSDRVMFNCDNGSHLVLINPILDFSNHAATISQTHSMFEARAFMSRIDVYGGEIRNAATVLKLFSSLAPQNDQDGGVIFIDGLKLPPIMTSIAAGFLKAPAPLSGVDYSGRDSAWMKGGVKENDMVVGYLNGWTQFEQDGLYPTLNAKLPDSASGTPWSMKCYPQYASRFNPLALPPVRKIYDQTAAAKTLTFEFLTDNRQTISDYDVWVEIQYTDDSTGDRVIENTKVALEDEATLPTSTASWTTTTYGTQGYNKQKIEITTANSVKQYTEIVAYVYVGFASFDANSFFFYDPDFDIA